MMHEAKLKAAATYNAAADHFDHPALSFWDHFGRATVDRLTLAPGATVLDVCSGTGASAIPAALRVGRHGRVLAVDLAENLVALAADKARRLGLTNLETRVADFESLELPAGSFDAVVNVFGIFFLPDVVTATEQLWQLVKPGGDLAITTWGPNVFEPASSLFWAEVAALRPDLHRAYNPWDDLTDPAAVRQLLKSAGAKNIEVEPVSATHSVPQADDVWFIVLGTGYRATYDAMTSEEQQLLRTRLTATLTDLAVTELSIDVIFARASKT